MDTNEKIFRTRLADINAVKFGDTVSDISASLRIVLTLYEFNDRPEIIAACKEKLSEGVAVLHSIADEARTEANNFDIEHRGSE